MHRMISIPRFQSALNFFMNRIFIRSDVNVKKKTGSQEIYAFTTAELQDMELIYWPVFEMKNGSTSGL